MEQTKPNFLATFALAIALLALALAVIAFQRAGAPKIVENSGATPVPTAKAAPTVSVEKPSTAQPEKIKKLLQEILATQQKALEAAHIGYERGLKSADEMFRIEFAVLKTKLELSTSREERLAVYTDLLGTLTKHEEFVTAQEKAGQVTMLDVLLARNARLRVEIFKERETLHLPPQIGEQF